MTPEIRDILIRAYGYAKGPLKRKGAPTDAELALAAKAGFPFEECVELEHDAVVHRLLAAAGRIPEQAVLSAFVAGLGGSWPRGRQPLISFSFARHLAPHAYTPTPGYEHCRHCGLPGRAELDFTEEVLRWHVGAVWNEVPESYLPDLEEFAALTPPAPSDEDRAVLTRVLALAAAASPDCTPGQFERELQRAKHIPGSDKYARHGLLSALAEVGVLPNPLLPPTWDRFVTQEEVWEASKRVKGSPRSDIVMPLAAWRGSHGVDRERAKRLFGVSL
ncbi:hypothetical protein P2318_23820 [Myxococcaceae bacterium GXIMD 01537]